jgi:hypothetical protein
VSARAPRATPRVSSCTEERGQISRTNFTRNDASRPLIPSQMVDFSQNHPQYSTNFDAFIFEFNLQKLFIKKYFSGLFFLTH